MYNIYVRINISLDAFFKLDSRNERFQFLSKENKMSKNKRKFYKYEYRLNGGLFDEQLHVELLWKRE